MLNQIFKCLVYFSLARSLVCIGNCCNQFLGCGNCLEQWCVNNTSCPHCRADIGTEETNKLVTSAFNELLDRCRLLFDDQSRIGFRSIFNFSMDPSFVNLGLSVGRVLRKSPMNLDLPVRSYVYFLSQHLFEKNFTQASSKPCLSLVNLDWACLGRLFFFPSNFI